MKCFLVKGFEVVLRWFLGGLFIYAGVLKVREPMEFLDAVRSFDMLADPWAAWVAMFLPWLEIFAGIGLIAGRLLGLYQGSLAVLTASMLVFLAALSTAWARGLDIECGCFGSKGGGANYVEYILRDLALIAVAGWLWWRLERQEGGEGTGVAG